MKPLRNHRLQRTAVALLGALSMAAAAAPVGSALDRPALATRQAAQSVLLGAAQAGERLVAVGERGIVVLSDDNGRTWQQAQVPVSVTLTAVRFTDARHGIAVGHGATVLTTEDAGSTWTRRLDGRRAADLALQAAQAGGDPKAVQVAQQFVQDGPDKPLLDVLTLDTQRALAIGAYGLLLGTEDGGRTWASWMSRLDNPRGLHLYAVRARGPRIVIAGEQGLLFVSDDGGRSFVRLVTPYNGSFFTAELPADGEIVVAGLRGNVWRSTDSGGRWTQLPTPMPASVTGSALRADGSVLLVNQAGAVLAGRDGPFVALKTAPMAPLSAVLVRRDGSLLALGLRGASSLPAGGAP
jgi:photosystem II stability/assembly factor-like uncharacterized protein